MRIDFSDEYEEHRGEVADLSALFMNDVPRKGITYVELHDVCYPRSVQGQTRRLSESGLQYTQND